MKLAIVAWLVGLLGFGLLVGGVLLINIPAGLIVAGLGLLAWSYLADRAAAAMKSQSKPQGG